MESSDRGAVPEGGPVWSHAFALDELFLPFAGTEEAVGRLDDALDWLRTWTTVLRLRP
ncbi:hypothetical protein ACWD6P_09050 [Streptomyces sp. NPDC002446]